MNEASQLDYMVEIAVKETYEGTSKNSQKMKFKNKFIYSCISEYKDRETEICYPLGHSQWSHSWSCARLKSGERKVTQVSYLSNRDQVIVLSPAASHGVY